MERGVPANADEAEGENACLPVPLHECTEDTDCPKSPSGKQGRCVEITDGHGCYFPYEGEATGQYSCW